VRKHHAPHRRDVIDLTARYLEHVIAVFRRSIDCEAVKLAVALLFGAACGTSPPVAPPHALGMLDVSILSPLPASTDAPALVAIGGEPTPLVGADIYARLVGDPADVAPKVGDLHYADFQVAAVRFELCVRDLPRPCEINEDARLRLVLQPVYDAGGTIVAQDVALHAFYPIPYAQVPGVIDELRALAAIQDAPAGAPLDISPALAAGDDTYRERLRQLVFAYARQEQLVRLTVMGQAKESAAFEWIMRGVARGDAGWAGSSPAVSQRVANDTAQLLTEIDKRFPME
jgi:hypothetical protein